MSVGENMRDRPYDKLKKIWKEDKRKAWEENV